MTTVRTAFLCASFWLCTLSSALSQTISGDAETPTSALTEVVVTAQKRPENLQDVPISISVFDAQRLETAGIANLEDVALSTPGFQGYGTNGLASPHIRGIGTQQGGAGADNAVSLYVDGVYVGSASRGLLTLNNASQVEVLKGPQGTLFGRNTTAGVIQVTTRNPDAAEADLKFGYENYQTFTQSAYLSSSGTERLSANISVQNRNQNEGWGTNLFNGQPVGLLTKDVLVYGKVVFRPNDDTRVQLTLDNEDQHGPLDPNYVVTGTRSAFGQVGINTRDINTDIMPALGIRGSGSSLQIVHDFESFRLTSITAYRVDRFQQAIDFDLTPAPILSISNDVTDRQLSEELRISSRSPGPLSWTVGAYYLHSHNPYLLNVYTGGPIRVNTILSDATQGTESLSGFGQGTYSLTDATRLTLGARITHERRTLDADWLFKQPDGTILPGAAVPGYAPVNGKTSFSEPTWRIALDHTFAHNMLAYVSDDRGFKSGGFNLADPSSPPYDAERLDAYETGVKTQLLQQRVRANMALFYYDYKNIQELAFTNQPQLGPQIYNGPAATLYGLDLDLDTRPTDELTLTASTELLHSRFGNFPGAVFATPLPAGGYMLGTKPGGATGNELPNAPAFTGTITATYEVPTRIGAFAVYGSYSYDSGFYTEVDNGLRQGSFSIVSSSVTWTSPMKRYAVSLWGKNLTNTDYSELLQTSSLGAVRTRNAPRMFGADFRVALR